MRSNVLCFRASAVCIAAAFSSLSWCDASFSAGNGLTLKTADLSGQGIRMSFTTIKPVLGGSVKPSPSYGGWTAYGYEMFPTGSNKGTSQLNLTIATAVSGYANGNGSTTAYADDFQFLAFTNTSKASQTFTLNWSYAVSAEASANDGSAIADSITVGSPKDGVFYWNDGVKAATPNMPLATVSENGATQITLAAGAGSTLFIDGRSLGAASSFTPTPAPEPSGLGALSVGALGLLRLRGRRKSR